MEIMKLIPTGKDYLWGGTRLREEYGKKIDLTPLAETWECSVHPDGPSYVANGTYKGKTLTEVLKGHPEYLGTKVENGELPVLVKFIDAKKDLSVQVHPSDEYAREHEGDNGKTEMWYLLPSDADATLLCGLKQQITPTQYAEMVENDTICDAISRYDVKEGDCFFLPAGRIHAIGTGCFLAEIQQTSDVTYRIYDFKRKDKNGNYRELHTKQAAECINYNVESNYRTEYTPQKNQGVSLVQCPYFNTAVYDLDEPMTIDYSELDSFVILIGLKGEGTITDNEDNTTTLRAGESILVPATTETLKVEGNVKFLETYV